MKREKLGKGQDRDANRREKDFPAPQERRGIPRNRVGRGGGESLRRKKKEMKNQGEEKK